MAAQCLCASKTLWLALQSLLAPSIERGRHSTQFPKWPAAGACHAGNCHGVHCVFLWHGRRIDGLEESSNKFDALLQLTVATTSVEAVCRQLNCGKKLHSGTGEDQSSSNIIFTLVELPDLPLIGLVGSKNLSWLDVLQSTTPFHFWSSSPLRC